MKTWGYLSLRAQLLVLQQEHRQTVVGLQADLAKVHTELRVAEQDAATQAGKAAAFEEQLKAQTQVLRKKTVVPATSSKKRRKSSEGD